MKNILSFIEFINEGLWSKGIERSKTGEERIEDTLGNHVFTDGNGTKHKHGIKAKEGHGYGARRLEDYILDVIIHYIKKGKTDINLNILDMSDIESVSHMFSRIYSRLSDYDIDRDIIPKLKLDTSGWDLRNCTDFDGVVDDIKYDIGVNNWKVTPEYVKMDAFKGSPYYVNHLPDWFIFDLKDWAKSCVQMSKHFKTGVDRKRTKETGKQCYWVSFFSNVNLFYIPDEVTIKEINNSLITYKDSNRCRVNCKHLTSLKKLPTEFTCEGQDKDFIFSITLNNITDDVINIPKNTSFLVINRDDDITKLPKHLPCGISLGKTQLGHIEEVDGDLNVCNNPSITSLMGCPKIVHGEVDFHNNSLTNLIGSPEEVDGDFSCSNQGSLKSLKGCPKKIGGDFNFYSTGVTDIDDFPEFIGGNVNMSGCTHLNSFVGLPEVFNGDLDIGYCNVKSLEGLPKEVNGHLIIGDLTLNNQPVTHEDILKVSPDIKVILEKEYSPINLVTGKRW